MPEDYSDNQQEVEKLQLENIQLKKKLEQEELLHKSLYRQWTELNDSIVAKKRQVEQFSLRSSFYKYGFYVVSLACIPAYYFLATGKKTERIASDPQIAASPVPITNQSAATAGDTVQLTGVKPVEKKVIQTDTVQQKLPTINKPVIENKPVIAKPLTGTVPADKPISAPEKDAIYLQGWDAYARQLPNPYQRSSQKSEIWLQGWKDGENGVKKIPATDSLAR